MHHRNPCPKIKPFGYVLGSLLALLNFVGCALSPASRPTLHIDSSVLQSPPPKLSSAADQPTLATRAMATPDATSLKPLVKTATAKPARYSWNPGKAKQGPVTIVVSLSDQQAYVYRNGVRIAHSQVSTGKPGYETPTGYFTILQRKKKHKSNLYDDADMPYMQRLTWDGIALHGGRVPDYPASHGCIRFPHRFASKLYGITRIGSQVLIQNYHPGDEFI